MAHAPQIENKIRNAEYNFLNKDVLQEWERYASQTIQEITTGKESFFRSYGATNGEEFFAVAVENFFERSIAFSQKHPLLYRTLCRLLRQDPILSEKRNFSS